MPNTLGAVFYLGKALQKGHNEKHLPDYLYAYCRTGEAYSRYKYRLLRQ